MLRKKYKVYRKDLLYPELSYKIVGILFDIFNELGYGYTEKEYKKAIETAFKTINLQYKKELPMKISYKGKFLTKVYLDFLVENKIVLEIKQGNRFYKKDIQQTYKYLKASNLRLAILARFTKSGVKFLRIVNII